MILTEHRYETFTVLINRISRNIRKIKNQKMAEYNLKSVHISCLYYLYSVGSMTAAELCEYCEEDKAAISRAVEYLEANGYLLRNHQEKNYKSLLLLTDKGLAIGSDISAKITEVLDGFGSILDEGERVLFYRLLARISAHLAAVAGQAKKG